VEAVVSIDGVAKEYADRGDFARALSGLYATPVALAFKNKTLANAVLKVVQEMQADGSYQKLFDSYGVVPTDGTLAVSGPES
jgi:polar amino acid transport system substrate-binding protein